MNAPFKPPVIREVLAEACVSITDLKRNPAAVVSEARERQVAILSRNRPVAYMIAPHVWEYLCDLVEDEKLARMLEDREDELANAVTVPLADL